jgi:DNA polymerase-3 subunit alpha
MCQECNYAIAKSESKFINLHVHTSYSLLDGMSKPEDIIRKVKQSGMSSVAITEHGNVFSAVKMYKLAKENSIKHIYGCEFYITENRFERNKDKKYYHLTVLATNEQGRLNINKLSSLGYLEGFYYKPRIDFELLSQYKEGLIIMSGCMASEMQQTLAGGKIGNGDIEITSGNIERAKEVARRYRSVFGENYYMEVQSHRDSRQQQLNRAIVDIAKELGIEYVGTADSHFVDEEDFELHGIFIQIGTNRESGETYLDGQLQTEEEAWKLLHPALTDEECDIAIRNTLVIADKCNVHIPLSAPIMPHVEIPREFDNENSYLKELINKGWARRGVHLFDDEKKQTYRERVMYEYNAIEKMGFAGYFLLVQSYANSVQRRGIARGSAGGSLISYLLNITDIDPIPYGLYFERFIDVGALDLLEQGIITPKELKVPDVDLDFGTEDRDKVLGFIKETYGTERVGSLGTFQYIWDKSAIKDIGRVLNVPYDVTNKITSQLGDNTIEFAKLTGEFAEYEEEYPLLFEYAQKISGLPRSFGVHPCGKIVSTRELEYYSAVAESNGEIVLQGDMHDMEDVGLVKVDMLGLKTVDVVYDVLEMIGKDYEYINPSKIDYSDEKMLAIFRQGLTEGIFQFESEGMKETLKKMQPNGLDDLGVANALYRPSSMKYIDVYIKRKHGLEEPTYLHEDMEQIIGDTMGIMVFQEQLISLGRMAGMSNADILRKATGKKDIKLMEKAKVELFDGLRNRGWNETQLDQLWKDMINFASYSFNKSHSYAYAIIAVITAMLKAYHPVEFMTALLNSKIGKSEVIAKYIAESTKLGIEVLTPSINVSEKLFTPSTNAIEFGLLSIKGVGEQVVETIISERNTNGNFNSLTDFLNRVSVDSTTIINLIKAGAFGQNKNELLKEYGKSLFSLREFKPVKSLPTKKRLMELGIIENDEQFKDKEKCLEKYNEVRYEEYKQKENERYIGHINGFTKKYIGDEIMYEYETLSMFLNGNPFEKYSMFFKSFDQWDIDDKILLGGTLLNVTRKKSKNSGSNYAKLQVLTHDNRIVEGMAFSSSLSAYTELLEKGRNVILLAKKTEMGFNVDKVKTLEAWSNERKIN